MCPRSYGTHNSQIDFVRNQVTTMTNQEGVKDMGQWLESRLHGTRGGRRAAQHGTSDGRCLHFGQRKEKGGGRRWVDLGRKSEQSRPDPWKKSVGHKEDMGQNVKGL
jgi:hypothetical protein